MIVTLNTTFGTGYKDRMSQVVQFTSDLGTEDHAIDLWPEHRYQRFEGFGGAVTDAAGWVYNQMTPAQKKAVMEAYFAPDQMNYQMIRVPIDSCDFSLDQYEAAVLDEAGNLKSLDFSRVEQRIFPMLRDAEAAAGRKIPLMLAPWSPPAAWKTNADRAHGGSLLPERKGDWAEYLCRYIRAYQDRGFRVKGLSVQNEPHAVQTWDSCLYTAREMKDFLKNFLYPALVRHGLTDVELYVWDHNKERAYEYLRGCVDEDSDPMITGLAMHWYSGDHFETLDLCARHFPGKKLIISESCIEFNKFDRGDALTAAASFGHEIIGDLNHGLSFFGDWNLLLDQHGGPHYVGNYCLAPFLYDTDRGVLEPQLLRLYFAHFSHFLTPGSVRIAQSTFSPVVESTSFLRPDGTIAVVLLCRSDKPEQVTFRLEYQEATVVLYPNSISTAIISG